MRYAFLVSFLALSACGLNPFDRGRAVAPSVEAPAAEAPLDATDAVPGESEDAAKDPAAPAAPGGAGDTVAGLGDPTRTGFWIETPLVSAETTGRVTNPVNGKWVRMTLLPSGGAPGSGSRLSAQAMQALGIPLTELATVRVSAGG